MSSGPDYCITRVANAVCMLSSAGSEDAYLTAQNMHPSSKPRPGARHRPFLTDSSTGGQLASSHSVKHLLLTGGASGGHPGGRTPWAGQRGVLQPGNSFREYLQATGESAALDAAQPWRVVSAVLRDALHALGARLGRGRRRQRWDLEHGGGAGHDGAPDGGGLLSLTLAVPATTRPLLPQQCFTKPAFWVFFCRTVGGHSRLRRLRSWTLTML